MKQNSVEARIKAPPYARLVEQLLAQFPDLSRNTLHEAIASFRQDRGGTLNGLSVDDAVEQIAETIRQSKAALRAKKLNAVAWPGKSGCGNAISFSASSISLPVPGVDCATHLDTSTVSASRFASSSLAAVADVRRDAETCRGRIPVCAALSIDEIGPPPGFDLPAPSTPANAAAERCGASSQRQNQSSPVISSLCVTKPTEDEIWYTNGNSSCI